jgi:midasin
MVDSLNILNVKYEFYKFGRDVEKFSDLNEFIENLRFDEKETSIKWVKEYTDGVNIVLTDGVFQTQSGVQDNSLVVMIDKCGIRNLSRVVISEGIVCVIKYLDGFPLKYCVIEKIEDIESVFIMALSELMRDNFRD